jgi:hypothetical protein
MGAGSQLFAANAYRGAHTFQRNAMTKVIAVAKTTQALSRSLLVRGS